MEQFTTKHLVWMRANIQEFKDPPEEYKNVLAKIDSAIIRAIEGMVTYDTKPRLSPRIDDDIPF